MPDRLFCILCKVPRFKEEAELRSDKERRMHPEARLLAVRPSQREAGVTWRGGRNLKKWIFFPKWLSRPERFWSLHFKTGGGTEQGQS